MNALQMYSVLNKNINASENSSFDGKYNSLTGQPQINGITLSGNKTLEDLGVIQAIADAIGKEGSSSIYPNAGAHNSIYRGKQLGNYVTDEQYAQIAAGTFEDLYIGDYWIINEVSWRIAAFDYYLNCGSVRCTNHHVVIVPDTILYSHVMNDTSVTTGGYVGSKMYKTGLAQAKSVIKAAFLDHILKHKAYLINAVTNGYPSAVAWCDSEVELMNEQMVCGGAISMPMGNGSNVCENGRIEKTQLPLFAMEPSRICNNENWWLRDVASGGFFSVIDSAGVVRYTGARGSAGVRPCFAIF